MSSRQDLSEVFLKNGRQQKLLDLRFQALEKIWLTQVKVLNREKLDTTAELVRLLDERRNLKYFNEKMRTDEIRHFTEKEHKRLQKLNTDVYLNKFDFDRQTRRTSLVKSSFFPVLAPSVSGDTKAPSRAMDRDMPHTPKVNQGSIHSNAKLYNTKLMSVSDTTLNVVKPVSALSSRSGQYERGATLPEILLRKGDDSRQLKQRMVNDCVLPPVKEVVNKRKLSI